MSNMISVGYTEITYSVHDVEKLRAIYDRNGGRISAALKVGLGEVFIHLPLATRAVFIAEKCESFERLEGE